MKELVCILIIGIVLFSGCAGKPAETTSTLASSSTTLASTTRDVTSTTHAESSTTISIPSPTTTQAAETMVHIAGFSFSPGTITVSKGATVTWVNDDPAAHTLVSDSGVFSSGSLGKGDTFSRTFTDSGTFGYHCGIHPSMKGKVVVQ